MTTTAFPRQTKFPKGSSKTSEHSKLIIQIFKMENKESKEKVMDLRQELFKKSLKVSENLDQNFTSIMAGKGQQDIPPFKKFLWEE